MIPTTRVAITLNSQIDMVEMDISEKKMAKEKEKKRCVARKEKKGKRKIPVFRNKLHILALYLHYIPGNSDLGVY